MIVLFLIMLMGCGKANSENSNIDSSRRDVSGKDVSVIDANSTYKYINLEDIITDYKAGKLSRGEFYLKTVALNKDLQFFYYYDNNKDLEADLGLQETYFDFIRESLNFFNNQDSGARELESGKRLESAFIKLAGQNNSKYRSYFIFSVSSWFSQYRRVDDKLRDISRKLALFYYNTLLKIDDVAPYVMYILELRAKNDVPQVDQHTGMPVETLSDERKQELTKLFKAMIEN